MQRTYLLHLPSDYSATEALPLVIAMHGGFGSGPNLENQSQLSVKADEENFIVVYPEGVAGPFNIRTWNAGECCGYSAANNIDDVGFISALIDSLIAHYAVDTMRIYATGMSNGAFMSYRLACELSTKIAAIAPVAGSMALDECLPAHSVPIIHFHSYLDSNVPYSGGYGDGVSDHYNPPLDSVLNVWSSANGCNIVQDTLVDDNNFTHIIWDNCECNASIEYYITHDGGHSWPGGNETVIGDPVSNLQANDLMWDFFEDHPLECDEFLLIKETPVNKKLLKVFPNPTKGNFILVGKKIRHVVVYNYEGKEVFELQIHPSDMLNIDLAGEPIGNYFIKVLFSENKKEVVKIVLQ
jgi:polyhydroxybutyrate depolymerase